MMVTQVWTLILLTYLGQAEGQAVFVTMNGPVSGETIDVNGKSVDVMLSIPFAKPPVGELRFKPPQPVDTWTGVLEATKPSPACIQANVSIGQTSPNDPRNFEGTYSEDCLYLNIWKPSSAKLGSTLPVMLWIYGGGFNLGTKDTPHYNGQYLASYDVIVVSVNYRVGLLGFGYLGPDTLPGNLGLLDQLEAMKWVRNNIDGFGGDPEKVTIFGESAGSWSVGLHHFSTLSTSYFQNAIMQSGAPISSVLELVVYSHERSRENVRKLSELLACPGYSDIDIYNCLMRATAEQLTDAVTTAINKGVEFYPVVDGNFLREKPQALMERGQYKKNKVLMGFTKDEFADFFPVFFNVFTNSTFTGQKLTPEFTFRMFAFVLRFLDENLFDALRLFYESMIPNEKENFLQVIKDIGSDLMFSCPSTMFGSVVSSQEDVYFYVLNYRVSTILMPLWTGVPHTYDMDLMFGHPLDPRRNYTDKDKEVSRMMMTYWTNFAKSGSPNYPLPVTMIWPTFTSKNQTYMELDSGNNLATRHGPRRHECAFINEILPKIPLKGEETTPPPPCVWPERSSGSGSFRQVVGVVTAVTLMVLTVL